MKCAKAAERNYIWSTNIFCHGCNGLSGPQSAQPQPLGLSSPYGHGAAGEHWGPRGWVVYSSSQAC